MSGETFVENDYIFVRNVHSTEQNPHREEEEEEEEEEEGEEDGDDDVEKEEGEEEEGPFWVARVLEIRARDPSNIYLRVHWAYWPEDLPGGRQPYHGKNELIGSNHMEIIDVTTVAGKAEAEHWTEHDRQENPSGLFWRQIIIFPKKELSVGFLF